MNTTEYRDEVDCLRDTLSSFKSCVGFEEKERAITSIQRAWRRMAMMEQPKRLPKSDADRCERFMAQAADLLNEWLTDVQAGVAQESKPVQADPAIVAECIRRCRSMRV